MPNSVILGQTIQAYVVMESRQKNLTPCVLPLKVIGTDTDRSATYDFLLVINHEPISHRFRDKRRFWSKMETFSHPVYLTPPLKNFVTVVVIPCQIVIQEAQLMLTTGSTRLTVSRGQQTWYHSTCYI